MENYQVKLSILMPVRNEGINIKIMLKILNAVVDIPHEVLIIYDSPDDNAIAVVKGRQPDHNHVQLIYNNLGPSVLNAVKAGIKAASGEYILLLAVDDLGPVLAIEDMISLLNEGYDLVSCTRYAYGGRRLGGSFIEGMLSRIANKLFCFFSGSMLSDATTGCKMFRKEIFENIVLESRPIGWAFIFEFVIKAQKLGVKMGEVPIVSIDRLFGGKSTFLLWPWVKEYLRWFIWGIRHLPKAANRQGPQLRIPKSTAI